MSLSLTLILVVITVLISLKGWKDNDFQRKWMFNPYSANKYKQYYRFLSSGFIHGGYIHLIFNMLVLYIFGERIEHIFTLLYGVSGKVIFLGMYLLAIVVSSIPSYIKHKHAAYYNSLGASGGTSAILFSYVLFDPNGDLCLYGLLCLPGLLWLILYMMYSVFMSKQMSDNINHDAHIFGGIFGIIYTIIVFPGVIPQFIEQLSNFKIIWSVISLYVHQS